MPEYTGRYKFYINTMKKVMHYCGAFRRRVYFAAQLQALQWQKRWVLLKKKNNMDHTSVQQQNKISYLFKNKIKQEEKPKCFQNCFTMLTTLLMIMA